MSLVASLRSPVRIAPCMARLMSGERFGHSNGDSGWRSLRLRVNVEHSYACMKTHTLTLLSRWDKNGVGMGGKEAGPGTEVEKSQCFLPDLNFSSGEAWHGKRRGVWLQLA